MVAYTPTVAARDLVLTEPKTIKTAKTAARGKAGPGIFRRIFAVMQAARLRQAEREIALYLSETGGKFTDESEREIERRFLSTRLGR